MVQLKLDENLPTEAAELLRDAGHDAVTILDQQMGGQPDQQIIDVCLAEGRVLVTLDLDFCDIRNYPPNRYPGLIVLRLGVQSKLHVLEILQRLLPTFEHESITGRLWIVDETTIRIRE